VLNYTEDRLILTAVRDMVTGKYIPFDDTTYIDVCTIWRNQIADIQKFIETTRNKTDMEGYVIRFETGHMVKLKCDWYLNLHRIKEQVNSERSLLDLWLSNGLDDAKAILSEAEVRRIDSFIGRVIANMDSLTELILVFRDLVKKGTRKEFAIGPAKAVPSIQSQIIFKLWDKTDVTMTDVWQEIRDRLKASLTNNQMYEKMKNQIFSGVDY
jgi:RNA ligase